MAFIDKIENIQRKPDHIKRWILFAGVFVIMFIIVSVWVSTLKVTLGDNNDGEKKNAIGSPLRVFGDIIKDGIGAGVEAIYNSPSESEQNNGTE